MKIGFVASTFDLLHAGHILMLKEAASMCDHLIVGLHVDPSVERSSKNKPVQTLYERFIQLEGCKYVDDIIPYSTEEELINILKTQKIDIRFLGSDYINSKYTGEGLVKEVHFHNRNHDYSSSALRRKLTLLSYKTGISNATTNTDTIQSQAYL
jgi:glycerol-3-phosphate cytidylyltransferase